MVDVTTVPSEEQNMSMLDKLKGLLKGHEDQARQGVEKAGDAFDRKTGDKYKDQVDMAQKKIEEQLGAEPPKDDRPPHG
ncbi:kanamycin biosynthetic protein [Streptomyces scopuliridis RB72]|uniref:Kanamycin biosynthetic protein n=2 Tax=Streptomyces scopuliridis TaxID=452529 RepID=A0A2T7SPM2_9ACTN|nr:kanamycin biosynthetic protein [Streptomyces scopuliridis RB72]